MMAGDSGWYPAGTSTVRLDTAEASNFRLDSGIAAARIQLVAASKRQGRFSSTAVAIRPGVANMAKAIDSDSRPATKQIAPRASKRNLVAARHNAATVPSVPGSS